MAKFGMRTALVLAIVGTSSAMDAWAADVAPTKAPPPPTGSPAAPRVCTDPSDFFTTNCQLTWQGITVQGTIDTGVGWQSNGAPFDSRFPAGTAYLVGKQNRSPLWTLAPNGLGNSAIGIKGKEPIGGNFSVLFAVDAGFDPYSLRFSDGPGSVAANAGIPQNLQSTNGDSSRAGQWYNGQGYVGVSSPTYGTLTAFRQNSLMLDAVINYDPLAASYAFSPIGYQGIACGGGNTENCRYSTSVKYKIEVGYFRAAALWQLGGYDENNGSNGAYQLQLGSTIPTWGKDEFSVDVIYSHVKDSVALALAPGANNAAGMPIPPFLPQTLTATISDNTAAMFVAGYATGGLKLYAGYEYIRFAAPSDPQSAFTNIGGGFVCQGCQAYNNTNINNTAFGVNGLGNKVLQIMWAGARYAVTDELTVMAGYYHYIQNSYFGTAAAGPTPCFDSSHSQCGGTFDAISAAVDWRFAPKWDVYFGLMFSQQNDGLASGFLQRSNIDPTVGLRFRF